MFLKAKIWDHLQASSGRFIFNKYKPKFYKTDEFMRIPHLHRKYFGPKPQAFEVRFLNRAKLLNISLFENVTRYPLTVFLLGGAESETFDLDIYTADYELGYIGQLADKPDSLVLVPSIALSKKLVDSYNELK